MDESPTPQPQKSNSTGPVIAIIVIVIILAIGGIYYLTQSVQEIHDNSTASGPGASKSVG